MKTIKFKKPVAIDIDGIARAYVVGDVRDYLPDNVCTQLVGSGQAEYVETEAETKTKDDEMKAEIKTEEIKKKNPIENKENKLMKPEKKANK